MNRRSVLASLGALALGGCRYLPDHGLRNPCLTTVLPERLAAHELVQAAWNDIDPQRCWDCHVHLLGTGDAGTGTWINPAMRSPLHPIQYLQYKFYMNAACVTDFEDVDQAYLKRLMAYQDGLASGCRLMLLAFDFRYTEAGQRDPSTSAFHVSNDHAARITAEHPTRFEWVASIHPYRRDCIEALEQAVGRGARAIKWLPPAMGMDPGDPRCDPFYDAMRRLDIPLLTHAGHERAVGGADAQALGNPLRLRRALDHGVRVIVAHCASLGTGRDIDRGAHGPELPNFELFARMMDEPRNADRLFGDVSGVTQINRAETALPTLLERDDWHSRLLNGSDYPLPGVMPLFTTRLLTASGYIAPSEAKVIAELRRHNPLLFDFVLKRTLRQGSKRFSRDLFETRRLFEPALAKQARNPQATLAYHV